MRPGARTYAELDIFIFPIPLQTSRKEHADLSTPTCNELQLLQLPMPVSQLYTHIRLLV